MTAALARAALTAHTGYRHKPADLLQRVSDTLWQSSTSEQLLSLLYARIDPFSGEGEVALAGSLEAVIGNRYGSRSVCSQVSDPLNSSIEVDPVIESFHLQLVRLSWPILKASLKVFLAGCPSKVVFKMRWQKRI